MKTAPAPTSEPKARDHESPAPSRRLSSAGVWLVFIVAIVGSVWAHELGHCTVAWLHGYGAIPTPAKEYILQTLPQPIQCQMALGGIIGSVVALVGAMLWLYRRPTPIVSAILAGALTMPGFYTLRFILAGRGHDGSEFQEAQSALGFSYSGHSADWLFVGLFLLATAFWFWRTRTRPNPRLVGRLALGAVAGLVTLALLQTLNNAVFDPILERPASRVPSVIFISPRPVWC